MGEEKPWGLWWCAQIVLVFVCGVLGSLFSSSSQHIILLSLFWILLGVAGSFFLNLFLLCKNKQEFYKYIIIVWGIFWRSAGIVWAITTIFLVLVLFFNRMVDAF